MKPQNLIFFVLIITVTSINLHHFQDIQIRDQNRGVQEKQQHKSHNRILSNMPDLTSYRKSIRITIDSSLLSVVINPSSSVGVFSFIKNSLSVMQQFLTNRLLVFPETSITIPPTCVDLNIGSSNVMTNAPNTDLLIYATSITSSTNTYTATGKSCAWSTSGVPPPDVSLRYGRPTVGRIKFNTYPTLDNYTLSNRLFATLTANILREMIHILGFDSSLYGSYLNPQTGNVYSTVKTAYTPVNSTSFTNQRPALFMIKTTNVVKQAQIFFGCDSLAGMQLQNQGQDGETGTGWQSQTGSHWQRSIMYDEVMTITDFDSQKGISVITYALLQDMGWYTVDMTFNDTSNYGYKKGCDFVDNICYSTNVSYYNQFCSTITFGSIQQCTTQHFSKATCQKNAYSDGCGIWTPLLSCVDSDVTDSSCSSAYCEQNFGPQSFCVSSSISIVSMNSNLQSRCYPYICDSTDSTIKFQIGSGSTATYIQCGLLDTGQTKTINSTFGKMTCPSYSDFCLNSRKLCPDWCSQNGFCTGGICNCLPGYAGVACNISCGLGEFYDPNLLRCSTSSCSLQLNYINYYDFTCLPCSSSCKSACTSQPTICQACLGTNALYSGKCVSECPPGYFNSNNVCGICSSDCQNCSISSSFCISCPNATASLISPQPSQTFLDKQTGTCATLCTNASYLYYDLVNFICVSACNNNLVQVLNTYNCIMCDLGYYKSDASATGTCQLSTYCISNNKYADPTTRWCIDCNSACQSCNGPNSNNCTSCSSPYYLYNSICVTASYCPVGTFAFANSTTSKCLSCNSTLKCYSCISNLTCSSCIPGYYYSSNICLSSCPLGTFANRANQSCIACISPCQTCSSNTNTSCLSCVAPSNLFINSSGSYCLTNCPNSLYYSSNYQCLSCYSSCKTCSGGLNSNCLTCITGMYLYQNHCYYTCPQGTYKDNATSSCLNCDSTCSYCFGSLNSECFNCTTNYVLDNTTCKSSCSNNLQANQYGICWQPILITQKLFWTFIILLVLLYDY